MEQIEQWLKEEDVLIADLEDRLRDMLASFMDQTMADYARNGVFTEPGHAAVEQLVDGLTIGWTGAVTMGVQRQPALLQKADGLTARSVVEYVREYGLRRTRQVVGTTGEQLNRMILSGQRDGLSSAQIAKQIINAIPQIAATRARIIAKTEIHSAAQFGSYNAARRSGKLLDKQWNTIEDDRTRTFGRGSQFSHKLMQGVKSPLDISFRVPHYTGTFEEIRFPGDPEGSAGNIINCRCIMTYKEK